MTSSNFAGCYGITLGQQPDHAGDSRRRRRAREPARPRPSSTSRRCSRLAPKADIEVYEGGASDSLYNVFSQIVNDDTAKIVSASWTNGCEAYVGQSIQNSENTLFQAAAAEGQSVFVASGDQGAQGCNINGEIDAATGSDPVAQAVDPSTGTLYVANKSSNTVSVDSEGSAEQPGELRHGRHVSRRDRAPTPSPSMRAADRRCSWRMPDSTLTAFSTSACNQVDDERLRLADADRLGWPSQRPGRARR